jgi:hypothetical protein
MATATIKGRTTAGTGDPQDLSGTQATTLLDTFTSSLKGLAPASGGGTANYLRADSTWANPLFVTEGSAPSPSAGIGKLWANSAADARPYWIDDTGRSYNLTLDRFNTLTYGVIPGSVAIDTSPALPVFNSLALNQDTTFTTTNLDNGRSASVRVVCDGTTRNLTFPAGWTWLGSGPPAVLAAGDIGYLSITAYGTANADVVAAWSYENMASSVTAVSVVTANGLAGTVANSTTTPAITLSTSVTGLLKGSAGAITAAVAGTDYAPAGNYVTLDTVQTITAEKVISVSTASTAFRITQTGAGEALRVEDSTNPDSTPFVITASGDVGIGTNNPQSKLVSALSSAGLTTTIALYNSDLTNNNGNVLSFRSDTSGVGASSYVELAAIRGKYTEHSNATRSAELGFFVASTGSMLEAMRVEDDGSFTTNYARTNTATLEAAIAESGTATGTQTSTTLRDTSKGWIVSQFAGAQVTIIGGIGVGQVRTVVSNTGNTLNVTPAWTTTPVAASTTYAIALNTTIGANHNFVFVRGPGSRTIILPQVTTANVGREYVFRKFLASQLVVTPNAADSFDYGGLGVPLSLTSTTRSYYFKIRSIIVPNTPLPDAGVWVIVYFSDLSSDIMSSGGFIGS